MVMMLESSLPIAETAYRDRGVPVSRRAATQNAKALGRMLPQATELAPDIVAARINHGRWVVDCPWCTGAQVASLTDRRFLCADCFNSTVQGRMVAVAWPDDGLRGAIEAEMLLRPETNRNWEPGETVEDLIREREAADQVVAGAPAPAAGLEARIAALEALLMGSRS